VPDLAGPIAYLRKKPIRKQVGGIFSESARQSHSVYDDDINERRGDRTARRETYPMDSFFERPILNSPYAYPDRHWELDDDGQPTSRNHRGAATVAMKVRATIGWSSLRKNNGKPVR
jgi:hypothetical protein